jgi:hypothetical protein
LFIRRTYGLDELMDFVVVFDAFEGVSLRIYRFNARADVYSQRFTAWPNLQNAIGHVGSVQPTT